MNQLNQCGQFLPDRGKFLQCAADSMASPEQLRVMNCYRDADGSNLRFASCVSGAEGRGLRRETINCIETSMKDGTDIDACAATQFGSPDVQRLITCASQSSKEQGQVNWIGTAICMAGNTYLTPEQTIVAQCMVNSGGEPLDFVACAGGQLTSRELNKCLSEGIGGDNGCFGNNNSVIIALRNMENDLRNGLGPNNDLVKAVNTVRNDLTHGPGPNNDLVRATNQIGQAFQQVGQQTQDTIRNVFPGLFH